MRKPRKNYSREFKVIVGTMLWLKAFFKTLKTEQIYGNKLISKEQMKRDLFEYIEIWYNRKRRHSGLNYKTIEEFSKQKNNFKNVA